MRVGTSSTCISCSRRSIERGLLSEEQWTFAKRCPFLRVGEGLAVWRLFVGAQEQP